METHNRISHTKRPQHMRTHLESGLLLLSLLLFTLLMASCQSLAARNREIATPTNFPPPNIVTQIITISPNLTPSPTAECVPLLPGMSMVVTPVSHTSVLVDLKGFQPGENITLRFTTADATTKNGFESGPIAVNQDGSYSSYEPLFITPDRPKIHWHVQVLHSHGAACTEVDMP